MSMSSSKRRAPAKLAAPIVKANAKRPTKTTIDETKTAVSATVGLQNSQVDTIEISSDEESDQDDFSDEDEGAAATKTSAGQEADAAAAEDDDDDDNDNDEESAGPKTNGKPGPSRKADGPEPDHGEGEEEEEEEEPASPSFGELLRGSNDTVDLTVMLKQPAAANGLAARAERTAIVPPTHQSLVTVLSQALSTDDTDLLESCLHTKDLTTIKNTIERIDSALAGILLTRLAARLHRRPGRAGTLMTWVRWTLIAHGGALASQPKVVHSLGSLQKVLAERARGLNSLLALKGKLDILEGQMELRRKMHNNKQTVRQTADNANLLVDDDDDDDDDNDAIYVEGEELDASAANGRRRTGAAATNNDDDDDDDVDDDALANGFPGDSDDEDADSADDAHDSEGDGADEPLDEDEVNYDDVDESMGEGEDEESDVEAAPPAKLQKVAKRFKK